MNAAVSGPAAPGMEPLEGLRGARVAIGDAITVVAAVNRLTVTSMTEGGSGARQ